MHTLFEFSFYVLWFVCCSSKIVSSCLFAWTAHTLNRRFFFISNPIFYCSSSDIDCGFSTSNWIIVWLEDLIVDFFGFLIWVNNKSPRAALTFYMTFERIKGKSFFKLFSWNYINSQRNYKKLVTFYNQCT